MTTTVDSEIQADAVAGAALVCHGVAALSGGPYGTAATYLPGRRVVGVRIGPAAVTVHVVAEFGRFLPDVGERVMAAVGPLVGGRTVDVVVEDITDPPGTRETSAHGGAAS